MAKDSLRNAKQLSLDQLCLPMSETWQLNRSSINLSIIRSYVIRKQSVDSFGRSFLAYCASASVRIEWNSDIASLLGVRCSCFQGAPWTDSRTHTALRHRLTWVTRGHRLTVGRMRKKKRGSQHMLWYAPHAPTVPRFGYLIRTQRWERTCQ